MCRRVRVRVRVRVWVRVRVRYRVRASSFQLPNASLRHTPASSFQSLKVLGDFLGLGFSELFNRIVHRVWGLGFRVL
jgi:hypothetical protein